MYTVRVMVFITVVSMIQAVFLDLTYVEAETRDESSTDYNILGFRMCLLRCGRTFNCRSLYFDQYLLECRLYDHPLKNYTKVLESRTVIGTDDYVKRFVNASCMQNGCSENAVCVPPSRHRNQPVCVDEEKQEDDVKTETDETCSGPEHVMIDQPPTIFPLNAMNIRENYCALAASTAFPRMLYLLREGHLIRGILEVYSLHQRKTVGRIEITVFSERRHDWSDVTVSADEDNKGYWIYVALADMVVRFKEMKTRTKIIKIEVSKSERFEIREPGAPLNAQKHTVITRYTDQGVLVLENGNIRIMYVEQGQLQEQAQVRFDEIEIGVAKAVSFSARTDKLILRTSNFGLLDMAAGCTTLIDIPDVDDVTFLDVEWDPAGTHVYILSWKQIKKYPVQLT